MPTRDTIIDAYAVTWTEHLTREVRAAQATLADLIELSRGQPKVRGMIRATLTRLTSALEFSPPTRGRAATLARRNGKRAANQRAG